MRFPVLLLALTFTISAAADEHPGYGLYKRKTCATCHANDGGGGTPTGKAMKTPDLRAEATQKQSDAELAAVVADGKGKMPGFKSSMTAEQIRDVVAYIRTLRK